MTAHVELDVERTATRELLRARRLLLYDILRPYRRQLVTAAAAVLVSTLGTLGIPLLIGRGIDRGVSAGDRGALAVVVGLLVVAVLADYGGQRVAIHLSGRVAEQSLYDLRTRLWRHVQSMSLEFFERQQTGRIVSRATTDVEAVYELFSQAALTLVSNLAVLTGITIVLFVLDPVLAAIVMAFIVPTLVLATWVFKVHSERAYRTVRERIALVIIHMAESLTGMRVVQAFSREPLNQEQFDDVNRRHREANAETISLMSMYGPGVEALGQIATFIVLLAGGFRAMSGDVSVGVLAAFLLFLRQFFDPIQELSQFFNSFQGAAAGLEKIAGVLLETSTLPESRDATPLEPAGGRIAFERVSFGYRDDEVLHEVDFVIEPGETVALVGSTGAGKSTLAKLVARFYDPTQGRVTLDGQDLRAVTTASLRSAIAVVPQEAFLFGGTIADNISLGRVDATREQIEAAAAAVGAHDFITALPEGYDTDVNKRGARLSGGQRQLLSFARAWLVDPAVLVLDEATSALDLPSERLIQRALRTLLADRTAIVIAHRFSSIEIADRVAVVEAGRIVEHGTPDELLRRGGRFAVFHEVWERTIA